MYCSETAAPEAFKSLRMLCASAKLVSAKVSVYGMPRNEALRVAAP